MISSKLTVPVMTKRLDTLLKAVRYSGSTDGVTNKCATCNGVFPIKDLQCGHFIKRGNQRLKYVSVNLMPQCRRCNHYLDGAQDKAAYRIIEKYGVETFKMLVENDWRWQSGQQPRLKRSELVDFYNYWLMYNRHIEETWKIQLIPKSWEPAK